MQDEVKLLRHNLGSITDLEPPKDLSESELKGYSTQIYQIFPILEKDIKEAQRQQILLTIEAGDEEKLNYGRGTLNGISLLYELWQNVAKEYEAKLKDKGDFDKNSPIAEL